MLLLIAGGTLKDSKTKNVLHGGSTILILRTKDYAIMAADSKQVLYTNNNPKPSFTEVCKIRHFKNQYYAMAGYFQLDGSPFNAETILLSSQMKTADETIEKFKRNIRKPLDSCLKVVSKSQPQLFNSLIGNSLFSIALVNFENNIPNVKFVNYKLYKLNGHWTSSPDNVAIPIENPQLFRIGEADAINKFLNANPNYFQILNPETALINLIKLEEQDRPEKVGGPIDVIKIDKTGHFWYSKKPVCED
ncbi:MAG TPA: hypothetical protein VHC96_24500 [Puia sp.]|nr:hypothetical protein [Puia sp.]